MNLNYLSIFAVSSQVQYFILNCLSRYQNACLIFCLISVWDSYRSFLNRLSIPVLYGNRRINSVQHDLVYKVKFTQFTTIYSGQNSNYIAPIVAQKLRPQAPLFSKTHCWLQFVKCYNFGTSPAHCYVQNLWLLLHGLYVQKMWVGKLHHFSKF